jgi:hypothetical protein
VLLTYQPLCLGGGGKKGVKAQRNKPIEGELVYLVNPASPTKDFVDITKNDAAPSVVTETPKIDSQFAHGVYYAEINKPLYQRIFGKRNLRGLADQTMAPFESDKGCDKVLGTGDREENATFFSEVIKSHIAHNELDEAKRVSDFTSLHKITLSEEACKAVTSFFKTHATALQQEHALLAPQVAKNKAILAQQVAITATLERFKATNPEAK